MYEGFVSTAAPDIDTVDFRGLMWRNLQRLQAVQMLIHFLNCTCLDFAHDLLTDEFAGDLAMVHGASCTLKTLFLNHNQFTDGARVLVAALSAFPSLEMVNLSANQIYDVSAKAVAAALHTNSRMMTLQVEIK